MGISTRATRILLARFSAFLTGVMLITSGSPVFAALTFDANSLTVQRGAVSDRCCGRRDDTLTSGAGTSGGNNAGWRDGAHGWCWRRNGCRWSGTLTGGAGGATGAGGAITITSGAGGSTSGASGALALTTGSDNGRQYWRGILENRQCNRHKQE